MFEATGTGPATMKLPPVVERIEKQTEETPAPICVLVVGMAGSGKTTLMAQLQQSTMIEQEDNGEDEGETAAEATSDPSKMPAYCINLDPATLDVPYSPSIDIRDTVDYKVRERIHLKRILETEIIFSLSPSFFFLKLYSKSCRNTIWVQMEPS